MPSSGRRGRGLLPAVLGVALLGAGGWLWFGQSDAERAAAMDPVTATVTGEDAAADGDVPPPPEPPRARPTPGAPTRLVVPALDVDAAVLPVRLEGDVLVPPSDPTTLGWWAGGAEPGARRGSALLTGHTVHTGGGALDDLETLRRGDEMVVETRRGEVRYRVGSVEVFSKGTIRRAADRLFDQESAGRLVVVTCEDWDGSAYHSNVVVTATPVG